MNLRTVVWPALAVMLLGGIWCCGLAAPRPAEYTYVVVRVYPHDRTAFTQGLEYRGGFLYEGTGLNGRSSLRKVKLETGEVLQKVDLGTEYFGEGITLLGDEIFQVTWQSQVGFVYGVQDFRLRRRFSYRGEGWGMANDGRYIYLSDGTAEIRVLDPRSLKEVRRIRVTQGGEPVKELNELEFVQGEIYANVWQTDRIARISPRTGEVLGWIDLTGLLGPMFRGNTVDVLNGIAFDPQKKRLFVTGKLWPSLFEIRVVPKGRNR